MVDLKVRVKLSDDFTQDEANLVYHALRLIEIGVPTQEYKTRLLGRNIKHDRGHDNKKIHRRQVSGWDRFSNFEDGEIFLEIRKRKMKRSSYASTSMGSGIVTINSFFLWRLLGKPFGAISLARTLWHEYNHGGLGYTHPWFPRSWYRKSVPYVSGNVLGEVLELRMEGYKLTKLQGL